MWLGDFPEDHTTVVCMFTTHDDTAAPVAPSSAFEAADVLVYKNGSNAQKTTTNGVTMTSPFDSVTGLHCVVIDTSNDTGDGGFWVPGAVYTLVLSPDETVDGVSVAKVIGQFGIELYGALRPTTSGRKLDVSAGGEAGLDWANIGSPTTTVNLSGTTVKTATDVETDTADIQSRLPAALVSGRIDASVGAMANNTITAAATAADYLAEVNAEVDTALADYDGPTHAELVSEINAVQSDIAALNDVSAAEVADAVWDEDATGHQTQGTFGQAIGDPGANTTTIYQSVVTDAAGTNIAADIIDIEGKVDDLESRLGTPSDLGSGATVAANLVDIEAQTDNLPAIESKIDTIDGIVDAILDDTGTAGVVVAAASKTGYALSTAGLAAFFTSDSGETYADAVAGSVVKETADNAGGSSLTAADIADAVWDEARADHTTNGTFGQGVASVQGNVTGNVGGNVTGSVGSIATGGIAAASFAAGAIDNAAIAADAIGSSELAASAVTEIQSGLATASALSTLDGKVDTIDSNVDAIKAKTDNLPSDPADQSLIIAATDALATLIGDVPTNSELATALASADDAVLAQVALVKEKTDLIPGTQDGKTFAEMMVLMSAVLLGKASGLDTNTAIYRAINDSKDRVTATVDANGNRSAVTLDAA